MITAEHLVKTFGDGAQTAPALNDVSLAVNEGEFVSVAGRSGSGKSTLLNVLSTLLAPDSGSVLYKGQSVTGASGRELDRLRSTDFSIIFQFHHLMPYLTALENTLLPFMKRLAPVPRGAFDKARECLERVGLGDKHDRLPGQLSGGEQQRVAIARALVKDARVLFADEPTGSLDKTTGDGIMQLLRALNRDGLTIVMVTHDPDFAARAGRVVHMADGRIVS